MTSIDTAYNVEPPAPTLESPDSGETTLQEAVDRSLSYTVWKTLNRIIEEARAAFGAAEVPLDLDNQSVGALLIKGLYRNNLVACFMSELEGTNQKVWASAADDLNSRWLSFYKKPGRGGNGNTEQSPEGAPAPVVVQ